jgi:hypothetical protein
MFLLDDTSSHTAPIIANSSLLPILRASTASIAK